MQLHASSSAARLTTQRVRTHQDPVPESPSVRDSTPTCSALCAIVERYITSIDAPAWPATLRAQGDRAIDAACQYGLGLIRMLAEYQQLEGLAGSNCVQLADRLASACREMKAALARADPTTGHTIARLPSRKSTHAWRTPARLCDRDAARAPTAAAMLSRAGPTAPPAKSASAGTPAARGSGGSRAASCR